jgi:hypothetical protein
VTQGVVRGGHHVPGHVYHWKHGWIPLTHFAALQKAHGSREGAIRYLAASKFVHGSHSPGEYTGGVHKGVKAQETLSTLREHGLGVGSHIFWRHPSSGLQTKVKIVGIEHTGHIVVSHSAGGRHNALIGHSTWSAIPHEDTPFLNHRFPNPHVHTIPRENMTPSSTAYKVDYDLDLKTATRDQLLTQRSALKEYMRAIPTGHDSLQALVARRLQHVEEALGLRRPTTRRPSLKPKTAPPVNWKPTTHSDRLPETFTKLDSSPRPILGTKKPWQHVNVQHAYSMGPHKVIISARMNEAQRNGLLSDVKDLLHATEPTTNGKGVTVYVPSGDSMFRNKITGNTLGYVLIGGSTIHLHPKVAKGEYETAARTSGHFMPAAAKVSTRQYVLAHELGHVVHNQSGSPELIPKTQGQSGYEAMQQNSLSRYGRSDAHEAYAESFAQHVHGGPGSHDTSDKYAHFFGWQLTKPKKTEVAS